MKPGSRILDDARREGGQHNSNEADLTAVAALRSGCSFVQAAAAAGLSVERARKVWEAEMRGPIH